MRRLMAVIADFMIGWHQGGAIRHRRREWVWRARLEHLRPMQTWDASGLVHAAPKDAFASEEEYRAWTATLPKARGTITITDSGSADRP